YSAEPVGSAGELPGGPTPSSRTAVPAAGVEPAAFSFSGRRSYRLSYTGRNQRRRQESNLRQGRVAADRRSRPVRRLQQARAGGGTRTHLVRVTRAVPGPSSIAGLFKQPVLVSSQLDRGSEPRSPPEGLARSRSRASGGAPTPPPPLSKRGADPAGRPWRALRGGESRARTAPP